MPLVPGAQYQGRYHEREGTWWILRSHAGSAGLAGEGDRRALESPGTSGDGGGVLPRTAAGVDDPKTLEQQETGDEEPAAHPQGRQLAPLHRTRHRPGVDAEYGRRVGDGDDGGPAGPQLFEIQGRVSGTSPHEGSGGQAGVGSLNSELKIPGCGLLTDTPPQVRRYGRVDRRSRRRRPGSHGGAPRRTRPAQPRSVPGTGPARPGRRS